MRTEQEILSKIEDAKHFDFFGAFTGDLVNYLSYEAARPFLNEDATAEEWNEARNKADHESIRAELTDYMPFAWGKANDCRGLSAARSLDHMKAWLWMLGEDAVVESLNSYDHYGKPQLRAICEHFNIDWRALDDGDWRNDEGGEPFLPNEVPEVSLMWRAR